MSVDLTQCKEGNHKFEPIYTYMDYFDGPDDVVNWCRVCGCVTVNTQSYKRLLTSQPLKACDLFVERLKEDA